MQRSEFVSEFYDNEAGVVYRVLACRELTRAEVVREVQRAMLLREVKPKRGDFLTFRASVA